MNLLLLWVLFSHFIADFVFQTDKMALNKSKDFTWLLIHSCTYSFIMTVMIGFMIPLWGIVIILFSHVIIDGITSRITSYLWKKEIRHWFFVIIGLDQVLHYAVLFSILG